VNVRQTPRGGRGKARRGARSLRPGRAKPKRRPRKPLPRPGRRTWIVAGALLAAGLAAWGGRAGWRALERSPSLVVREVSVRGADAASPQDIAELAAVRTGESWLALDRAAAEHRVRAHPNVDRVRVRRPWIGKVRIDVVEHRPVARIEINGRVYGLCDDLRVVPGRGEPDEALPLLRAGGRRADPEALERGLEYLRGLRSAGVSEQEHLEVTLTPGEPDRIRFVKRGFAATVEGPVSPNSAARDVAAFLETLDGTGSARGTLRVISENTAVWRAAA